MVCTVVLQEPPTVHAIPRSDQTADQSCPNPDIKEMLTVELLLQMSRCGTVDLYNESRFPISFVHIVHIVHVVVRYVQLVL
jgi:hypothetical protein